MAEIQGYVRASLKRRSKMSQTVSNEIKTSLSAIEKINAVEGFDPSQFAIEYTDLKTNETRKYLPVVIRLAWFRLKYEKGKVSVKVEPEGEGFVATAKVYSDYKDEETMFLAEGTAYRAPLSDGFVSVRGWAQTAAIGVALRNAGFGLQFDLVGEDVVETMTDGHMASAVVTSEKENAAVSGSKAQEAHPRELTSEERFRLASQKPCPIVKYNGRTLGDMIMLDPNALKWVAEKYTGDETIKEAAKYLCDYAVSQSVA